MQDGKPGVDVLGAMLSFYREQVEKNPRDVSARAMLATALGQTGQPRKAVDEFMTCFRLEPNNGTALLSYGVFQCIQGHPHEGAKKLRQAIEFCEDLSEQFFALGALGAAYHMAGDRSGAIDCWEVMLSYPPHPTHDFPLHLSLAIAFLQNGMVDRALEEFRYAHLVRQDDATIARRIPGVLLSMERAHLVQWPASREAQDLLSLIIPLAWGICRPEDFF